MGDPSGFEKLVAIMDRLRGPDGCPWDREQSYVSLRAYLIEECHEVAEALDQGRPEGLREELGDLLFQIVFLSRLAAEDGSFTVDDVIRGITDKMIRRHPHVFGDARADTAEQVVETWEAIKRREKGEQSPASALDGVPRSLPALSRAARLGAKAARVGFDWDGPQPVLDKIGEELGELRAAMDGDDPEAVAEELGDFMFAAAMLARHLDVDPEGALGRANVKFVRRFERIEAALRAEGRSVKEADLAELERLWERAKQDGPSQTS